MVGAAAPLGAPARHLGAVGSTMTEAARWAADGAPHGALVTAMHQTAGRGRHGRAWLDAPGHALLLTLVLRLAALRLPPERLGLVPLAAGLALAETARAFGAKASVKWPNDVVVAGDGALGRKLAGVLADARAGTVLLGVGLNVAQAAFPPGLDATSLVLETGRAVDRLAPLGPFLERLAHALTRAASDPAGLVAAVEAQLAGVGAEATVAFPGTDRPAVVGTVRGLAPDGALVVATAGGDVALHAGETTLAAPTSRLAPPAAA